MKLQFGGGNRASTREITHAHKETGDVGISLALATWNHPYLIAAVKLKEKGSRVAVVFANFRLIATGNVKNQL